MEPKGAPIGPPAVRLNAGDPVRIWFRVRLLCSPPPNGLVGDGVLRPAEREWVEGFRAGQGDIVLSGEWRQGGKVARSGVLEIGKKRAKILGQGLGSEGRNRESSGPQCGDPAGTRECPTC